MKTHELKILPEYFKAVEDGTKTFELRKNDRGFKLGDLLQLNWYSNKKRKTKKILDWEKHNSITAQIIYMTEYPIALKKNYVALGIQVLNIRTHITYNPEKCSFKRRPI